MWRAIRTIVPRVIIPILAVVAILGLPIVPALVSAQDVPATPTSTTTPTPGATETAAPTSTPTAAVLIEPGTLTIYGKKASILPGALPAYRSAQLSVYAEENELAEITVFHPPLSGQSGAVELQVTPQSNCDTVLPSEGATTAARCYLIVPASGLEPGAYSGKLFVDIPDHGPRSVDLDIKVGLSLWWLLATVALGVIVTELLARWNGRFKHSVYWTMRRPFWLDLLSENGEWITGPHYSDDPVASSSLLQAVKTEIRSQISSLKNWLKMGREGAVKLADIPVNSAQDAERIFPLKNAVVLYVREPLQDPGGGSPFEDLALQFASLREAILTETHGHLQAALRETDALYEAFQTLFPDTGQVPYLRLKAHFMSGVLTDEAIKTAWGKIEDMRKSGMRLRSSYLETIKNQMSAQLPRMGELAVKLLANADEFSKVVLDVAGEQWIKVNAIAGAPPAGRSESLELLEQLKKLAETRERLVLRASSANEPLRYFSATTSGTGLYMQNLDDLLTALDQRVTALDVSHLTSSARVNFMLRDIRAHLLSVEAKLLGSQDEPTLAQTMDEIARLYSHDRRFFKLGERILKLSLRSDINLAHLQRAYSFLLEGRLLDAEVELKRENWRQLSQSRSEAASAIGRWIEAGRDRLLEWLSPMLAKAYADSMHKRVGQIFLRHLMDSIGERLTVRERIEIQAVETASVDTPARETTAERKRDLSWVFYLIALILTVIVFRWLSSADGPLTQSISLQWWVRLALVALFIFFLYRLSSQTFLGRWLPHLVEAFKDNAINLIYYTLIVIFVQILVIAVATALAVAANLVADRVDTWGSSFDFLVAFVWGVVANRVAAPLTSGWESLVKGLTASPETKAEATAK